MLDFVEGWTLAQTLGEGAYGEVKLLVNKTNGNEVAMKVVNYRKHPVAKDTVKKEVAIHKMLSSHPNIISCFGQREEPGLSYIFLEYAPGGELFDKIDPDSGMPPWEAQKYFLQLLSGVEYLHSRGIAHRDLKPENLLLDQHDNLKIADFGLATIFRMGGKERLLEKQCGTLPYVAPEVLLRAYAAEPADVWSCGVILVAMLAGELPWDKPMSSCREFAAWKDGGEYMQLTPWTKMDNLELSLLRRVLLPVPSQRYTIAKIVQHRWTSKDLSKTLDTVSPMHPCSPPFKRVRLSEMSRRNIFPCSQVNQHCDDARLCQSQPEQTPRSSTALSPCNAMVTATNRAVLSFSQPAQIEDLLVSTQLLPSHSSSNQSSMQRLVRRMTRFFVSLGPDRALEALQDILGYLGLTYKIYTSNVVTVITVDRHKNQLAFKASVLDMDGQTLLDFRLSKGCGLEFKRRFIKIKTSLGGIVLNGPVHWPIAIATNTVP